MPMFYCPMYSADYTVSQWFDQAAVVYQCRNTYCNAYGRFNGGGGHRGVDLAADAGKDVFPAAGSADPGAPSTSYAQVIVAYKADTTIAGNYHKYGNHVILRHVPSLYSNMVDTCYAHLQYGSIPAAIEPGAWVSINQRIGKVGTTGASDGNHLHFEVRYVNAESTCEDGDGNAIMCWGSGEMLDSCTINGAPNSYERCCAMYDPAILVPL